MSAENRRYLEGKSGSFLNETALTAQAAAELISPLVLLRQLSMAVTADNLSDMDRRWLGERLTLTSERALRLVSSLGMTSPTQTQFPLEPVNPLTVCQEVIHELSPLFAAHGKSITMQRRSRIPLLVANRDLLRRILLSFGDNALPYGSKDHPITLSIHGHQGKVRIGVRDFGPAVPGDIWERLEGRIAHHAQAPLNTRPQTSGMSLIASRRLAELMHSSVGTIRHQDGATFYVDLSVSTQMSLL